MFLLAIGLARAEETPERLRGFHFGLGGGVGWYGYTVIGNDGSTETAQGASTVVSARLRLSERWALEPTLRGSHEANEDFRDFSTERTRTERETEDSYTVGLTARVRLAEVDRVDLEGLFGASHARAWRAVMPEEGERSTAYAEGTNAGVGIGIEYWLSRRVSVGADLETDVLSWQRYHGEPSEKESTSLDLEFQPYGDIKVFLYF